MTQPRPETIEREKDKLYLTEPEIPTDDTKALLVKLLGLLEILTDAKAPTLFITDAEVIRRMGVPEKIARVALSALDRDPKRTGFPQKQKLWGNRRYWPAVKAYLDRVYGFKASGAPL